MTSFPARFPTAGPEFFPAARFAAAFHRYFFLDLAQLLGCQVPESLRDGRFGRLVDQRHAVVADFDHRSVVIRQQGKNLTSERFFGLFQTNLPGVQTGPVDDNFDLAFQTFDFLEAHHQPHDISQAR